MTCQGVDTPSPVETANYKDWPWQLTVAFCYLKWGYSIKSTLKSVQQM